MVLHLTWKWRFVPSNQTLSPGDGCMNYVGNQTWIIHPGNVKKNRVFPCSKIQLHVKNHSVNTIVDRLACESKSHKVCLLDTIAYLILRAMKLHTQDAFNRCLKSFSVKYTLTSDLM